MRSSCIHTVQSEFNRKKTRTWEVNTGLQTFWRSNDYYTLAEILIELEKKPASPARPIAPSELKTSPETQPSTHFVSLFVAEADIFSNIHKIDGDIIICDVNRKLLQFINNQRLFLLNLYKDYTEHKYSFKDLLETYTRWFSEETKSNHPKSWLARINTLGIFHFLSSEENFIQCMNALNSKKLVTLDIDLFDSTEQKLLIQEIRSAGIKVKLIHLTNLPDYDRDQLLPQFLDPLPWAEQPRIIWNIHNRGITKDHNQQHFVFSAIHPQEYKDHIKNRPSFFAEIDKLSTSILDRPFDINSSRRYQGLRNRSSAGRFKYLTHYRGIEEKKENLSLSDICTRYQTLCPPRSKAGMTFYSAQTGQLSFIHKQLKNLIVCQENRIIIDKIGSILYEAKNLPLDTPQGQLLFQQALQRALFLYFLAKNADDILQKARTVYLSSEEQHQIHRIKTFLKGQLMRACADDTLSVASGRTAFLNQFFTDSEKSFPHELFNSKEHRVPTYLLNTLMLIPAFGLTKYFFTGSSFFYKETRQQRLINSVMEKGPSPSPRKLF
jgi:hypothetical protein